MLIMQRRNVPPNKQSSSIYKQSLGVSNGERLAGHKSCERLLKLALISPNLRTFTTWQTEKKLLAPLLKRNYFRPSQFFFQH